MKKTILLTIAILMMATIVNAEYLTYAQTTSRIHNDVTSYDRIHSVTLKANETPIYGNLYGFQMMEYGCAFTVWRKYDGSFKPHMKVLDVDYNYRKGPVAAFPSCSGGFYAVYPGISLSQKITVNPGDTVEPSPLPKIDANAGKPRNVNIPDSSVGVMN